MNNYIVKKEEDKIRIDKLIVSVRNDLSRTAIQRMIEKGNILVNERKVKISYKVSEGDLIKIKVEKPQDINIKPQEIPLDIIYEDNDILIINKQKGIVVHPGARKS